MLDRRRFLSLAAVGAMAQTAPQRVIDTHIHLFDPTRPQGVPWPPKENAALYKPALPARYRTLTAGLNIVGAIEVECSSWLEDNQWVLDLAARDKIIAGTVGNLDPGDIAFRRQIDGFHRNPIFRGIRFGNLWGRNLGDEIAKPAFVEGLKLLAAADLVLDTANPDAALIHAALAVTDRVPSLRVVIDHLPQMDLATAHVDLRELAARPQVFVKISQVLRRVNGRVPIDLPFYRSRLDETYALFGEDRVLYGSDWPNSDNWAGYADVFNVVRAYFAEKSPDARDKYFYRNSQRIYKWKPR
ncbi:MAG TPA: amidohydrolase family protein [Candidatus Solibacter sp.]|nr:amidohydrolase family protein [Candidatus Solibacter sp.]